MSKIEITIKLPDYKSIAKAIKKTKVQIEDKEIEDVLFSLQKSRAKLISLTSPVKLGDFVEIEYSSPQIENGKVFEDGFLLGKGHLIPGFEENLVGMEKDSEKEFQPEFPKNYSQKDLAGKKVDFKIKLKGIKKMELPEISDEFAKNLGKFENLEALKQSIKQGLLIEKEIYESRRIRTEILKEISNKTSIEIPEVLVGLEKKQLLEGLKQRIKKELTISFDDYLKKIQKTEKEIEESLLKIAEDRIKNLLILRKIGELEKIEVGENEVKEKVNEFLKNSRPEQVKEIDTDRLREYYKGVIFNEKVFQKLENFII